MLSNSTGRHAPDQSRVRRLTLIASAGVVLVSLSGCQTLQTKRSVDIESGPPDEHLSTAIPAVKLRSMSRILAAKGLRDLDTGRLASASAAFNKALKMDITNPYLNFFNAVAYQMRAEQGESQYFPLAEEGYKLAIKFDPTNAVIHEYLGTLYYRERDYAAATDQFSRAAVLQPRARDILFQLAESAYYSRDPITAEGALKQLRALDRKEGSSPAGRASLLWASAMNKAALDQPQAAQAFLHQYSKTGAGSSQIRRLDSRLQLWADAYRSAGHFVKVADTSPPYQPSPRLNSPTSPPLDQPSPALAADASNTDSGSNFIDGKMVVVDVVIIGTEEASGNTMGVNLLNGLQLQFGDPINRTPAFSITRSKNTDLVNPVNSTDNKAITSLISVPAVSYSMNIANSASDRNQVLARPTLVARSGQTSTFFSGVEISAAATSGGNGDSVQVNKQVGVKMTITPQFAPNGTIFLNVVAERTFLTQPSSSVQFTYRLDTSKTSVNAHVAMKLGQTLILSGLSERETENNRDGVPLLQDVPLLQYAFSRKTTHDYNKSIIIMLTPRRAQAALNPDAALANAQPSAAVRQLRKRHPSWFPDDSNLQHIFKELDQHAVADQFRPGDMGTAPQSVATLRARRMRNLVKFLYF